VIANEDGNEQSPVFQLKATDWVSVAVRNVWMELIKSTPDVDKRVTYEEFVNRKPLEFSSDWTIVVGICVKT
jgi:hypothetical protein